MKYTFPKELYIAYATCKNCGNREFIVSGQTQFCNQCGKLLFREDEMLYTLIQEKNDNEIKDAYIKGRIFFPQEIIIGYAKCSNTQKGEEVVVKDMVICQECKERMTIHEMTKYFLNNNSK